VKTVAGQTATETSLQRIGAIGVPIVVSALIVARCVRMLMSPNESLVCFIPDDAFYELQIARHFLASGRWSFDQGFSTTTGFHLLNVYLMSLFPRTLVHPWFAIRCWMLVGLSLSVTAVFVSSRFVYRVFGPCSIVAIALVFTAPSFSVLSGGLLEYPYVVLMAALYVACLFGSPAMRKSYANIFCLGLVGSIARSDFGGLPLAIFLACSIHAIRTGERDYFSRSLSGLVGAAAGLAAVFVHNFVLADHILSGSARVKSLWGTRVGYSLVSPVFIALQTVVGSAAALIVLIGLLLLVTLVHLWTFNRANSNEGRYSKQTQERAVLKGAGLLAVLLYVLTYGADPSAQVWYTANFLIPFLLLLAIYTRWVSKGVANTVLTLGALIFVIVPNVVASYRPPWPNQSQMLLMAQHLAESPVKGRIAGWNVGVVGYLLDGKVSNLDGLMNDQIYPYISDNDLLGYLDQSQVEYIVDYPFQTHDPRLAAMNGYDRSLAKTLIPLYTAVGEDPNGPWVNYTLYKRTASANR
jgi:hypothetical protein